MNRKFTALGLLSLVLIPLCSVAHDAALSKLSHPEIFDVLRLRNSYVQTEAQGFYWRRWLFEAKTSVLRGDMDSFEKLLANARSHSENGNGNVCVQIPYLIHLAVSAGLNPDVGDDLEFWIAFNLRHRLTNPKLQPDIPMLKATLAYLNSDNELLERYARSSNPKIAGYSAWLMVRIQPDYQTIKRGVSNHKGFGLSNSEQVRLVDLYIRAYELRTEGLNDFGAFARAENRITVLRATIDPVQQPLLYAQSLNIWSRLLRTASQNIPQMKIGLDSERLRVEEVLNQLVPHYLSYVDVNVN